MILAPETVRIVEWVDRRVLGAFRLVDATAGLPVAGPARVMVRAVAIADPAGAVPVPLANNAVVVRRNTSGLFVLLTAPFFDDYVNSFGSPLAPAETAPGPLRLHIAAIPETTSHLPQEFDFELPRSLDHATANSVHRANDVALYRAPASPVLSGWSVLRVHVTQAGGTSPLPGVLVRVFREPRAAGDSPIGAGMTEWRGRLAGDGMVALTDIPRFRPGSAPGDPVFVTNQEISFDVLRDSAFTGASGQFPDVPGMLAESLPSIIHPPTVPPGSVFTVLNPPAPILVSAGRELTVHIEMP